MEKKEFDLIRIIWSGPYTIEQIKKNEGNKIGLYQIYGAHPIYGSNVLLYIGKSEDLFSRRIANHEQSWIKYECDNVSIYLGEIIGVENVVSKSISIAEKMLIYYCAPAYNSNDLADLKIDKTENIIVMNFGKFARLPIEVSTLWYKSEIWDNNSIF